MNSFSVLEECYINVEKSAVFSPPAGGEKKIAMPPDSQIGDILLVYFYSSTCSYCVGMDEELDKVSKELGINIMKINSADFEEGILPKTSQIRADKLLSIHQSKILGRYGKLKKSAFKNVLELLGNLTNNAD